MFYESPYFYYITIALQAFCVIHCIRKGRQYTWIWAIVFLPVLGSVAYLFTEIIDRRQIKDVKTGMTAVIRPGSRIKKLEEQLAFADTFNNRIMLADAYLAAGQTAKAIQLYETSLTGAFAENEYGQMQLIAAYYETGRYEEVVEKAKKIYRLPQFARSRAHLLYTFALEKTGNVVQAEAEFQTMKGKFSNYESRYEYGLFLARNNRPDEARQMFAAILQEAPHLDSRQRSQQRSWFSKSKEALKKLEVMV